MSEHLKDIGCGQKPIPSGPYQRIRGKEEEREAETADGANEGDIGSLARGFEMSLLNGFV